MVIPEAKTRKTQGQHFKNARKLIQEQMKKKGVSYQDVLDNMERYELSDKDIKESMEFKQRSRERND